MERQRSELVAYFRDVNVTPDFGKTIGWTIKEGRDFSRDFPADSGSVILNETGAKITGLKNPVGEMIKYRRKNIILLLVLQKIC